MSESGGRELRRREFGGLVLAVGAATVLRPRWASASVRGERPTLGAPRVDGAQSASGQPYASNWHPAQLLDWDPKHEPAAPFMRSTTPIAKRVVDRYTRSNPDAQPARVLACSAFAPTDGNPAQGSPSFDYYTSEFWTYIDTLIFWGGSASEGLILAPNPTVTDAAHRNGVPVYGTIFFPPNVYGGDLQWVKDLLVTDRDGFPVARSLAAIASYYGFEGYFINQETSGADSSIASSMVDFMADLHAHGTGVLWYDAMTESGAVGWQGALNPSNDAFFAEADGMFVDFRWSPQSLASSAAYAESMGRRPDELFAGIDVGARQFGVQYDMDAIFPPKDPSAVSVALYRPDFTLTGTGDPSQYAARESRFWVGSDGDPSSSTPDADGWRGMSAEISEHASVTSLPFVTFFGTGHGHGWWHRGEKWQTGDWNNLTAQDVLPTWRWIVNGSDLTVDYDYTSAWRGASSVAITGRADKPTAIPLYATRVTVTASTTVAVVASGAAELTAVLRFLDDPSTDVVVPLGTSAAGWAPLETGGLSAHSGRTLIRVGLGLTGAGKLDLHLGELRLRDGRARRPDRPRDVSIKASGPGYRVRWRGDAGVRYDLEAVADGGARTWLGASTAEAFYVPALPRDAARVEVVPIAPDGRRRPGTGAPVTSL